MLIWLLYFISLSQTTSIFIIALAKAVDWALFHNKTMPLSDLPSVLWHCWLGVRKSIWPVKIESWGVGVVICLERGADCLHMVQLMPLHPQTPSSLASFKSRLVLPICYWHTEVVLEKRPLDGCSTVVVYHEWLGGIWLSHSNRVQLWSVTPCVYLLGEGELQSRWESFGTAAAERRVTPCHSTHATWHRDTRRPGTSFRSSTRWQGAIFHSTGLPDTSWHEPGICGHNRQWHWSVSRYKINQLNTFIY